MRTLPIVALLIATAGCGDRREAARDTAVAARPGGSAVESGGGRGDSSLVRAARDVVAFLAGELAFDSLRLADTVELRVAPEGGGASRRMGRDALRTPAAWAASSAAGRVSLVPPAGYTTLAVATGRHFNCQEQELATRAPDLATRPHVGVRLQPDSAASCLQSWNATLVFDTTSGQARLAAVLYDQWEW